MVNIKDIKNFVNKLRTLNLENERAQANINAAIVYLDLAIFEAAKQGVQWTDLSVCLDCGHSVEYKQVAGCLDHPVIR